MTDSDVVIRVEGLGKSYALHHETSERYTALRDQMARQAKAAGRLLNPFTLAGQLRKAQRQTTEASEEEFWALKDVSFEIRRGERVGIIGRNGAGKSTLLKILSRITEPTTGRVEIRGRVASLLEVGTGFHPELTGRENIYLNGAILGMTRREIRAKFEEIVDFAEVEKFLDTPVKRYSSGMYVRLAFAVAAHLEPEILVVDEVLAVGDASFQKKCLGKMEDVSDKNKRTVLFVSHNMAAIKRLCDYCLLLADGRLSLQESSEKAISAYNNQNLMPRQELEKRSDREGSGLAKFCNAEISQVESNANIVQAGIAAHISILIKPSSSFGEKERKAKISIGIDNSEGQRITHLSTESLGAVFKVNLGPHPTKLNFIWDPFPLIPGTYSVTLFLQISEDVSDWVIDAFRFEVIETDFYGSGKLPPTGQGLFYPLYSIK